MELAPLSQDRERTPAAEPAGNGQIVSGRSGGRRRAVFMAASGQLSGRLRAVSRGRRHLIHFSRPVHHHDTRLNPLRRRDKLAIAPLEPHLNSPHHQAGTSDRNCRPGYPPQRIPVHRREPPSAPTSRRVQRHSQHRRRSGCQQRRRRPPALTATCARSTPSSNAPIQPQNRTIRKPRTPGPPFRTHGTPVRRIQHPEFVHSTGKKLKENRRDCQLAGEPKLSSMS